MQEIKWHLAQINIAKMLGADISDPIMATFVAQLNEVNSIAEGSRGFVWRLKDDSNNATNLNPFNDERIIVNMSVWENLQDLKDFVYKGLHVEVLKNKSEWFSKFEKPFMVLWYIPAGHIPTVDEAKQRLLSLEEHGATEFAFDFRTRFNPPTNNDFLKKS